MKTPCCFSHTLCTITGGAKKLKKLLYKYSELIPYIIFGAATGAINLAVYALLYKFLGASNVLSTVIALIAAILFAFVTNKLYVFKSKSWARDVAFPEFLKFISARGAAALFEVAFMYITVDLWCFDGVIMKLIVNIVVVTLNYIASKFIIFKQG